VIGLAGGLVGVYPAAARKLNLNPAETRANLIAPVASWGYQLQRIDIPKIAASNVDLMVIDHAPDRVESVELLFRRAEIDALKVKPDGRRRIVLAYLSIGEAERYRFYWDDAWLDAGSRPSWLGADNPRWAGNYIVEYWQPAWQRMIFGQSDSYLDRIMEAGFDGVYLDRADVLEEFAKTRPAAEAEMIRFVSDLADHARRARPEFLVVLQNAEELVRRKDVRARIDAIAKESLYSNPDLLGAPAGGGTEAEERLASIEHLRLAKRNGRKVMVVEYTDDPEKARQARKEAGREGFLIHFAERTLSEMNERGPDQRTAADTHTLVRPIP
jgi:cysteinyl-tRNA synthetase, unknown class